MTVFGLWLKINPYITARNASCAAEGAGRCVYDGATASTYVADILPNNVLDRFAMIDQWRDYADFYFRNEKIERRTVESHRPQKL